MSRFYFATPYAARTVADEFRHWFGPAVLALFSAMLWDAWDLAAFVGGSIKRRFVALKSAIVARLPKLKNRAIVIGHHAMMPFYVAFTFVLALRDHIRELPSDIRRAYKTLAADWRNA